jgi:hypothetical protein
MENLNSVFAAAVESHGQDAAEKAAEASIEAYNTAAIAGMSEEACESEQVAAFEVALNG